MPVPARQSRCRIGAVIEPLNRPEKCLDGVLKQSALHLSPDVTQRDSHSENRCFVRRLSGLCRTSVELKYMGREGFEPPYPFGDRFTVCCL